MRHHLIMTALACISATATAQSLQEAPVVDHLDTLYNTRGCDMKIYRKGPYYRNDTLFLYECYCYFREYADMESQRVYIDRDTCSENFSQMLENAREDKWQTYDLNHALNEWKKNKVRISGHDVGKFKGNYVALYSTCGETMTSTYLTMPLHITDTTIVWTESDSWPFVIQDIRHTGQDSVSIDVLSGSMSPGTFNITMTDPERRVIKVEGTGGAHINRTFFVSEHTARHFPLIVFDCECVPDYGPEDFRLQSFPSGLGTEEGI